MKELTNINYLIADMEEFVKTHKVEINRFFNSEETIKELETNDFHAMFSRCNTQYNNQEIQLNMVTAALILSDVDFLSYIDGIYPYQFEFLPLTTITIPSNIEIIGDEAFKRCVFLETVIIKDGVVEIDDCAFQDTGIERISIPNSVERIGASAFAWCINLESIILPKNLHMLDSFTFYRCEKLKNVTIPKSVERIGKGVFAGCNNLEELYYLGTKEDWQNIEKGPSVEWVPSGKALTIHCLDGDTVE